MMGAARYEFEVVVLTFVQKTMELSVRLVVQVGVETLVDVVPGKMKEEKVPLFEVGLIVVVAGRCLIVHEVAEIASESAHAKTTVGNLASY